MCDGSLLEMPVWIKGSPAKLRATWSGDKLMVWGQFDPKDEVLFIRPEDRVAMAQSSLAAAEARVAALEAELDNARLKLMARKIEGATLQPGRVADASVASSSSASSSGPTDWLQQWRTESFLAKETAPRQARTEPPEHTASPELRKFESVPDFDPLLGPARVQQSDSPTQPQATSAVAVGAGNETLQPESLFPELQHTWVQPLTGTPVPEPTEPPSDQPEQLELPL